MSAKFKLRQGDTVQLISGAHKGAEGKILRLDRKKNRVFVEAVNLVKCHRKPTQDKQEGSIVEREASVHYSNLKLLKARAEKSPKGKKS